MKLLWALTLILALAGPTATTELKGLQFFISLFAGDFGGDGQSSKDQLMEARIETDAFSPAIHNQKHFLDFMSYNERTTCLTDKSQEALNQNRRRLLKVKCKPKYGNGTVHIVESIKDAIKILNPSKNITKQNPYGNCVLTLFYSRSCPRCVHVAPHFNALAKQFPDIKVNAIDAIRFTTFNAEFGIVGLPTILLFHKGRPVFKFNDTLSTVNNFIKFVTKHTGLEPVTNSVFVTSEDFNGPLSNRIEKDPDKYLYMSWTFIILCALDYFAKSRLYAQLIEMIKRLWRESEAHHEHIT